MRKTTKQQFDLFKKECLFWINKFGLNNYSFTFEWKNLDKYNVDGACNKADRSYNAWISFDTEIDDGITINDTEIKKWAKHEIIHLLLKRLEIIGRSRYATEDEFYSSIEETVTRLEKLL